MATSLALRSNRDLAINRPSGIAPVAPSPEVIEPKHLLGNLWRRKASILGIAAILMLITGLILSQVPSRYTAETLLMIESRGNNIVNFDSLISGQPLDNEAIASKIEVIQSRGLAEKVIDQLDLSGNPEFNIALRPKSKLEELKQLKIFSLGSWLEPHAGDMARPPADIDNEIERIGIVNTFLEGLTVARKGNSRAIKVSYTSQNPKTAATIVNALADLYLREQLETRFETIRTANKWLTESLTPLRQKALESETAVERYRQSLGLVESQGNTLNSQQMTELNNQIIAAQADYSAAKARLRNIEQLSKKSGAIETIPEVLKSVLIQKLREQEAEVQRRMGELSAEFGELHPKMIQLRAELDDLQLRIKSEVDKIISSISSEAQIARVRKASLEASLKKLQASEADRNDARAELRAMEREAEADREVLNTLLARAKETSSQDNINNFQPDARIISHGDVPLKPSYPKKMPILTLMLFASLLTGVFLVFIDESLDRGFRDCENAETLTGVRLLACLPNTRSRWAGKKPELDAKSAFAESVRTLYTSLVLASSAAGQSPRTILVTSTESGEGKTTLAVCLGLTRAVVGIKTLIVDLNLHKPHLHKMFEINRTPGLIELLSGDAALEEIVHTDTASGVDIITVGAVCMNPADILMSDDLNRLLETLREKYDLVILDSAPYITYPDTRVLLDKADATVFVVRWAQTKRRLVRKTLTQIMESCDQPTGIALNMVDMKT